MPEGNLRIACDASAAAKQDRTGVARYAVCLLEALCGRYPEDAFTLGYRLSRLRRHRFRFRPAAHNSRVRYFAEPFEQLTLGAFDLFHGLDARIPAGGRYRKVVTLHDIGPALRVEIAQPGFRQKKLRAYRTIAEQADRIICVSRSTRDAFRELYDLPEERFSVIHHGLEPRFRPSPDDSVRKTLQALRIEPPYLLFVGLLSERKNCVSLIRAFDQVASRCQDLRLVLAGGRAHGFERIEEELAKSSYKDRIVLPGFVPDQALPDLYSGADLFIFPGENEGFGMPMLEAMACGTPVLAANTAVAFEVAGEAAVLSRTSDPDRLAHDLLTLLEDGVSRESLAASGLARAGAFTWKKVAEETMRVYHEVLEEVS